MAMGHSACFDVVIEVEKLKEIVPHEWEKFNSFLEEKEEASFDEFVRAYTTDDNECDGLTQEEYEEAIQLLEKLQQAFNEKTGIDLYVAYHDNENQGDRYDEVEGAFFGLEWSNVYTLTPKAEKLQKEFGVDAFDIKRYVVYG